MALESYQFISTISDHVNRMTEFLFIHLSINRERQKESKTAGEKYRRKERQKERKTEGEKDRRRERQKERKTEGEKGMRVRI
jgi:hypothetical protein